MPGWTTTKELLREEFKQSHEEGKDPAELTRLHAEFEAAGEDTARLEQLHAALLALPIRPDFPFQEPSDLHAIRGLRPDGPRRLPLNLDDEALYDKLYGAWLGRCAGCALGKPVEGFMGSHNGLASWERQKRYLTAIHPDEWPLHDYFPQHSPAESETGQVWCHPSTREEISYMETDDDIRYTVLGQVILRQFGPNFSSANVAFSWFDRLPYRHVCTAETQAYRNMCWRDDIIRGKPNLENADDLIDWHWITHHLNPYREWIGAQIRIDSYGYACPGNPELAAEFAYRDARISHVKNGIYGAMLCAAMIAAAFATNDPQAIVEAGLAEIPRTSRLYHEMRQVIQICDRYNRDFANFEAVLREIYALLGHYHPVHTNNNAALCIAALLLSNGDFHKGITLAVMGGWDTDCNGATVGSIVGAITGAKAAPSHWTARLNDTLKSLIIDYHPIPISECARMALEIARQVNQG